MILVLSDEERKAKKRAYSQRPEVKARQKARQSTPEYKAKEKARKSTPEYKAYRKEYESRPIRKARQKAHRSTPENKAKEKARRETPEAKAYHKKYNARPENKTRQKAHRSTPEYKAYRKVSDAKPQRKAKRKVRIGNIRLKVLQYYSKHLSKSDIPCCRCCGGKSHIEFLSLDHIAGRIEMDSEPELVKLGYSSSLKSMPLLTWIIKNNFPKGFQILCHNCNSAKGYYGKCPHETPEAKVYQKEYESRPEVKARRKARRPRNRLPEKERMGNIRLKVLQYYSKHLSKSDIPCCRCCGEKSHIEFLALDHIAGRKEMDSEPELVKLGYSSSSSNLTLLTWIIKNNFPKGFQILCHNCNSAKGYYGKCPHQK